jgi:hypothetical protein
VLAYATPADAERAFDAFSDGLPVVLPTRERVDAFIAAAGVRDPARELGVVPPREARVTVGDVAVNAVMAGLPPAAFAIAVAIVRAALDPAFNLNGVQSTTHVATPCVIVSGPAARRAGMNAGNNALGQGNRANATLGRTLRLVMMNVGGGIPGQTDMAVQGTPAKFGFCFADRDDVEVWSPLAARQGAAPDASTVTLMAGEGPHVVSDHRSASADALANVVAAAMRAPGALNAARPWFMVFAVAPQHARIFAADGWDVARTQRELFARARHTVAELRTLGEWDERRTADIARNYGDPADPSTTVPVIATPKHLIVAVAGGDTGGFSSLVPSWPASVSVHHTIEDVS